MQGKNIKKIKITWKMRKSLLIKMQSGRSLKSYWEDAQIFTVNLFVHAN